MRIDSISEIVWWIILALTFSVFPFFWKHTSGKPLERLLLVIVSLLLISGLLYLLKNTIASEMGSY